MVGMLPLVTFTCFSLHHATLITLAHARHRPIPVGSLGVPTPHHKENLSRDLQSIAEECVILVYIQNHP